MPIADAAAAAFPRWDVDARAGQAAAQRRAAGACRASTPARAPWPSSSPTGRFLALVEEQNGKAKSLAVFG